MFIMIIILSLIPFCISAIYNFFYGKHINKQMNENKKRAWISPISVFFITFLLEFLIILILFELFSVKDNFNKESYKEESIHKYEYSLYAESEIDKSIYSIFDGNEVNGYTKSIGIYGVFSYMLYTCDYTLNNYPRYILITDYIGEKENINKETTVVFISSSSEGESMQNTEMTELNENIDSSNRIYHIIEPGEFQTINIRMYLFEKEKYRIINEKIYDLNTLEEEIRTKTAEEFSLSL